MSVDEILKDGYPVFYKEMQKIEHSNIQPFLIDIFHFRKPYCQLQMEY